MPRLKTHTSLGRQLRHCRVRGKISGTSARPRLSVFRSNRGLYVQIIDDAVGRTLLGLSDKKGVLSANQLGLKLAKQALAKKIKQIVFDRSGYRYTGRVRALAEGARAGGLIF